MRIIAGAAKGRRLISPKTFLIRPVADKVKGAIFNILGDIENLSVLDLFAGSGSVGLEAASRGAKPVVLVDQLPEALHTLKKNIQQCHFEDRCSVVRGRIPALLSHWPHPVRRFDLVFVDPPYDRGLINKTLEALAQDKFVDASSRVIIEHSPREIPACDLFETVDNRKYGQTLVSFLKLKE